jgi:hypothetical protein
MQKRGKLMTVKMAMNFPVKWLTYESIVTKLKANFYDIAS